MFSFPAQPLCLQAGGGEGGGVVGGERWKREI